MNKNIVIVHYNTPKLTECLVKSINRYVKDAKVYILDNSDKRPFTAKFDNLTLLDNTKGQIINFEEWLKKHPGRFSSGGKVNLWASAKHCYSVEKCMDIVKDNFILLDSDILLKRDISDLFDESSIFVGTIEKQKDVPHKIERLLPYLCFINYKMCKEKDVHYYYDDLMHGFGNNKIDKFADSYDTGAAFLLKARKHPFKEIDITKYMIHFGNGSWEKRFKRKVMNPEEWLLSNKKLWSDETNKKVVYTCITGEYDDLDTPSFINGDFDYICFTNTSGMTSNVWDIRPMPAETEGLSQVKMQRYVKINAHKILSKYDVSIWVDGSVAIKGDLDKLLDKYVTNSDKAIFVPTHPKRDCIYDEAKAVIATRKDKAEIVNPIMDRYKAEGFPAHYGLLQSNILIRKHNDENCIKLMDAWYSELKENSHRDQLSFNYVCWKNPDINVVYMDKMIYDSEWFKWGTHKPKRRRLVNLNSTRKENESLKEKRERFLKIIQQRRLERRDKNTDIGAVLSMY